MARRPLADGAGGGHILKGRRAAHNGISTMAVSQSAGFERIGPASSDRADTLARVETIANLMDSAVAIPGTRLRVGLDSLIGLVPGIGDLASALISSYLIWEARRLGLPRWKIARMMGNVALDTTVGAIPLVGDVLDVFYKSNRRNLKILREHLEAERHRGVIDAEYKVVRETK
jgi:hypothetical protein